MISILEYTPENNAYILLNSILKAWIPFEQNSRRDSSSIKATIDKTLLFILGWLVILQEAWREDLTELYHIFSILNLLISVITFSISVWTFITFPTKGYLYPRLGKVKKERKNNHTLCDCGCTGLYCTGAPGAISPWTGNCAVDLLNLSGRNEHRTRGQSSEHTV